MAISGTRVVVGAHGDDTGASDAGSAYVYDLTSGTPDRAGGDVEQSRTGRE